jgi:hypothetical protein
MAFNASGTDYGGFQRSRDRADEGLTRAQDSAGRAAKQARIKKSGERSGMEKLLSTAARGAAAYYTGGLSEQYGGGEMIDSAMLGTDSQGNAVKNEYGGLIKAGSGVYHGLDAKKKADIAGKRALNLQKFNQKKDLATEVGKLDKDQGIKMMVEADALRKVQENQTAAADDRSLWGWDNKYDDLEMTPSQIKGKEIAQGKQSAILSSEARRQGGQLDGRKAAEDQLRSRIREASPIDQGPSGEALDKGVRGERIDRRQGELEEARTSAREGAYGRSYKTDAAREEDSTSAREGALGRGYKSTDNILDDARKSTGTAVEKIEEDQMWKRLSNEDDIDREYNKSLFDKDGYSFAPGSGISDAELESNIKGKQAYDAKAAGYPVGNTYSEKEAKRLSGKDTDKSSSLDDLAVEDRVKVLKKQGFIDKLLGRSDEDDQLLLEDKINREQALKKEHARTGGPSGRADYEGSLYRPMKSRLRKKMEARRQRANEVALKRGGVLAGSAQ